jgi:ABC-type nickel/cobalt efflux system permease component RcnA
MKPGSTFAVLSFALLWLSANAANAHPLGNFSISQYSGIRIGADSVEVRYIIDMAEIPTFQELQEAGIATSPADQNVKSYLAAKVEALRGGLKLIVNGRPLSFQTLSKEIIFPPGAGDLPTLKIAALYRAELPNSQGPAHCLLDYRDDNYAGRAGWKEIITDSDASVEIVESSVPKVDRSTELSDYPTDLLNSPPQDLAARVIFALPARVLRLVSMESTPSRPGEQSAGWKRGTKMASVGESRDIPLLEDANGLGSLVLPDSKKPPVSTPVELRPNSRSTPRDPFTQLIAAPDSGWSFVLIALLVAVGLGAFHALEPGHGKTLVAAYLVGSRGTIRHALGLGLIVTAAHTAGVYLLGGVTLYASQYIVPERLYPWLGLFSGMMITVLGVVLVLQRYRGKAVAHSHPHHGQGFHAHHHDQVHEQEHHHGHHSHPSATASLRELLALGISGGIIPCPAALVVLLSAVAMNRIGFGLLLIVSFSAGLAAVLIALGLLMVYARQFMSRFHGEGKWVNHWLPIASSAFIVAVGIGLTWQACQNAEFSLLVGV